MTKTIPALSETLSGKGMLSVTAGTPGSKGETAAVAVLSGWAAAQVTRADYERSAGMMDKYRSVMANFPENPAWVEGDDTLIYSGTIAKAPKGGHEFVRVDAPMGKKQAAFDHARLADALSKAPGISGG